MSAAIKDQLIEFEGELEAVSELISLEDTPENRELKDDLMALISVTEEEYRVALAGEQRGGGEEEGQESAPKRAKKNRWGAVVSSSSSSSSSSGFAPPSSLAPAAPAAVPARFETHAPSTATSSESSNNFQRTKTPQHHAIEITQEAEILKGTIKDITKPTEHKPLPKISTSSSFVIPESLKLLSTDTEELKLKKRKKVKTLKNKFNASMGIAISEEKQNTWQSFSKGKGGKGKRKEDSMFRTGDEGTLTEQKEVTKFKY
jgi:hypothetical protein